MYGALWRVLPGPVWLRILLLLVLLTAAIYSLATWVFPWVETLINNQEATVGT
ncbi:MULTISPECIES: hypothetical protein [Microterricola]|uniref:DUF4175 domain-containing protein n=1 Tax=Microterricola viridarii TaxID=412690 RepID=A0A1H1LX45_9MICO|nr:MULTISPECIES: hypothetical protein [Microterricola]SDR78822.1 hypothetical protein SAMN04489834_0239 [Microterricola viridarii]